MELSRELGFGQTKGRKARFEFRPQSLPPGLQRFASQDAESIAGNKMALNVERIVDRGLNGQEPRHCQTKFYTATLGTGT
jgi:hypothetical protein